jgi:hypothetical protein
MIRKLNLTALFERVLKNNPDGSRKEHFATFRDEVKAHPTAIDDIIADYFDRVYATRKIEKIGDSHSVVFSAPERQRIEDVVARREARESAKKDRDDRVQGLVAKVHQVVMLDLPMPNGKKLRHCTFAETKRFEGFFGKLSKHGKPTQTVGNELNEADIRNLYSQFEKKHRNADRELHA